MAYVPGMDLGTLSLFLLVVIACMYIYINIQALAAHAQCKELKGTKKDENYRRYWLVSLIVAGTIPLTMAILKFFDPNGPLFMGILSFMGAIGSGLYVDTNRTCEPEKRQKDIAIAFTTVFSIMFFISLYIYNTSRPVAPTVSNEY